MTQKFSRHVNEQFRWQETLLSRLRDNLSHARHFKLTQAEYLERREKIWSEEPRLTSVNVAFVRGYMRALEHQDSLEKIHVRRIIDRPETVSSANWDDMTEELREACRTHQTESCLAWDEKAEHPWGPWGKE